MTPKRSARGGWQPLTDPPPTPPASAFVRAAHDPAPPHPATDEQLEALRGWLDEPWRDLSPMVNTRADALEAVLAELTELRTRVDAYRELEAAARALMDENTESPCTLCGEENEHYPGDAHIPPCPIGLLDRSLAALLTIADTGETR